MQEKKNIM